MNITGPALAECIRSAERIHHDTRNWGEITERLFVVYPCQTTPQLIVAYPGRWEWTTVPGAGPSAPGATGDLDDDLALLASSPNPLPEAMAGRQFAAVGLLWEWGEAYDPSDPRDTGKPDQRQMTAIDVHGTVHHVVRDRGGPPWYVVLPSPNYCPYGPPLATLAGRLANLYPIHALILGG